MNPSRTPLWTRRSVLRLAALASLAVALPWISPAAADEFDDLRAEGAIAERYDGFVMVRDPSVGNAQSIVNRVNGERKALYEARAKEQGVAADQVGQVYAAEILAKAPGGTWFMAADGSSFQK